MPALGEVGVIDVGGQPHQHPVRYHAHERGVAHDEPVAGLAGGRREILRPLLVERLVAPGRSRPAGSSTGVDTTGPRHALSCTDPEKEGSRPGMRLLMDHLQSLDRDMRVELCGR